MITKHACLIVFRCLPPQTAVPQSTLKRACQMTAFVILVHLRHRWPSNNDHLPAHPSALQFCSFVWLSISPPLFHSPPFISVPRVSIRIRGCPSLSVRMPSVSTNVHAYQFIIINAHPPLRFHEIPFISSVLFLTHPRLSVSVLVRPCSSESV